EIDVTGIDSRQVRRSHVFRHADNFELRPLAPEVQVQLDFLPDRTFARPELPRCRFAHDGHWRPCIALVSAEITSSQDRNTQRREITGGDVICEHLPRETAWWGFGFRNANGRCPCS